ncbi:MAG: 23S rRNA (adenine(2030)-N(6))-methyltransferase RlmJ [Candidatus Berkiellales bacterium]
MYSYQHRYHAGSFADLHKHLVLTAILIHLQQKLTPFCALDLYAGEGIYDLHSTESQKNAEYKLGIEAVFHIKNPPPLLQRFLSIIHHINPDPSQMLYPGSPEIIASFLRSEDEAILVEGHPQAFQHLKEHFDQHPQIHLHQRDALEAMHALTPVKRGLVFIDPSYEVKKEYQAVANAVLKAYSHFSHGIYAIWYPLLEEEYHLKLIRMIRKADLPKVWSCEWIPYEKPPGGIIGSGMILINPPWQLDQQLAEVFKFLNQRVFVGGKYFFSGTSYKNTN